MIDVKKFLKLNRLTLILIIFIILLIIVPITYSKFQSHAKSNADVKTAFYIIDSNSENKQIVLLILRCILHLYFSLPKHLKYK